MSDMSPVIIAKSDQINAADLIGQPRTVKVVSVQVRPGTEQPVTMQVEGDDKVFRPCKSVCRCLVAAWGADSSAYVGRSMTLYNDPDVLWAGMRVGGIRVSHMSDIAGPVTLALAENKKNRKPHTIKPLQVAAAAPVADPADKAQAWLEGYLDAVEGCTDMDELIATQTKHSKALGKLATQFPMLHAQAVTAGTERAATLAPADEFEAMEPAE